MGFRFRRSIRLGKGLRINLSKSGASLSVGRRGATMNFGPKGEKLTVGLPGSGLSYSQYVNKHGASERRSPDPTADDGESPLPPDNSRRASAIKPGLILLAILILFVGFVLTHSN